MNLLLSLRQIKPTYKNLQKLNLWLCIFLPLATTMLYVPRAAFFIVDAINIVVLTHTLFRASRRVFTPVFTAASLVLIIGLLGYSFNGSSFFCLIWGARVTLRFFVFLFNCSVLFNRQDIEQILSVLHNLLIVGFVLGVYQFLVLGLHADMFGAMFGIGIGSNEYLIAYLSIVMNYCIGLYAFKKISTWRLVYDFFIILFLSAIGELKVILLLMPVLMVLSLIISDFRPRTVLIVGLGVLFLVVAIQGLALVFPESANTLKNLNNIMKYAEESYTGGLFYSRTNGFTMTNDMFFKGSILKKLFGYGLGQCDRSSIDLFSSEFFRQYGSMNFYFFFYAMMYLEVGILGLLVYVLFLLYGLFVSYFMTGYDISWLKIMSMLNIVTIIIMVVYNYSLRSDCGYIWMFALAIPYICSKRHLPQRNALTIIT